MPLARGRLLWSDEFNNGPAVDKSKWKFETAPPMNSELEEYVAGDPRTARVEDGALVIHALRDGDRFISARLNTLHRFNFTYGVVETKMQVPFVRGMWPAFWMLGTSIMWEGWPACGEIDIMEVFGTRRGANTCSCVHNLDHSWGTTDPLDGGCAFIGPNEWHVWTTVWTPERIAFYLDGELQPFWSYERPSPPDAANYPYTRPAFLIANLAVGGNGPSEPLDEEALEAPGVRFSIDYVRVYALPADASAGSMSSLLAMPAHVGPLAGGAALVPSVAALVAVLALVSSTLAAVWWHRHRRARRMPVALAEGLLTSDTALLPTG